jgi:orotidine-5'-phosphate decarboxylase
MDFTARLRSIQQRNSSLVCVGLDPDPAKIPQHLSGSVAAFCSDIIAATSDLVCAYKLNLAFFESLGEHGWVTLREVLASIPDGVLTIGDGKRGDIGNTATMYAKALLHDLGFTATTVSAYMGEDSVRPFIEDAGRGAFVLALTSNPGARDFQYLRVNGKPLYEHVVARGKKWNGKRNVGFVVGATRPSELKRVRTLAPEMPLLIPGMGAQGGDMNLSVRYGCDRHGELAVINASRSIIYASGGRDFAAASRRAALSMRDEINSYRMKFFGKNA